MAKLSKDEAIRKYLNLSPDIPTDRQLAINFIKNKWANYNMFRDTLTPGHREWLDEWFKAQHVDLEVSAPAPKKEETESAIPVKRKFDEAKIVVNAEAFYKLVRNVVRGNVRPYEGRAGINFVTKKVIGAKDPKQMWLAIRDNIIPKEHSDGELSDEQGAGRKEKAGSRAQKTGRAVRKGAVQEDVGKGSAGVDKAVGAESEERAGESASVPTA